MVLFVVFFIVCLFYVGVLVGSLNWFITFLVFSTLLLL